MKGATIQRVASPTAILVGLSETVATLCSEILVNGGLRVLKVGHVAAAAERIPVVMPHLVVVPSTLQPFDAETLTDRCVAVGAEVLSLEPEMPLSVVEKKMRDAANEAVVRALRRGH